METTAKEMVKWKKTIFYSGGNTHQSSTCLTFLNRETENERKNKCERKESWWWCHLSSCQCCHPWCLWKAAITCVIWLLYKSALCVEKKAMASATVRKIDEGALTKSNLRMLHKMMSQLPSFFPLLLIFKPGARMTWQELPVGEWGVRSKGQTYWVTVVCT